MNDPTSGSKWNLDRLPDWAKSAIQESFTAESPKASSLHQDRSDWPLLVDAALVSAFLPRDLAPETLQGRKRSEAERAVLDFAETTYETGGVKWSLTREKRTEVLDEARKTGDLSAAITRTAQRFPDPVSYAIRECLKEGALQATPTDLKTLEATRIAVASLSGVPGLQLPAIDDLDREIDLRRLLAQFERMIGLAPSKTLPAKPPRFFGRAEELERLRSYVGVVPAASLMGAAQRFLNSVTRALTGRVPMAIWGVGGVGKTTLISKFMLEHADAAISRYPFAYLDFDRSTVSARRRAGLLEEMCLQVGAQFAELTTPMTELRSRIREFTRKMASNPQADAITFLVPYMREFRGHVDRHLDQLESRFEWARPFLLVFDTFEVVQYAPDDVAGLEEFVRNFSPSTESGTWPRLRLVISGRKKVTEFLEKVEELPLGALDPKGSTEMLVALAEDAGKSITSKQAAGLVTAAAGERKSGVPPLRLRLIGELFRKIEGDGPAVVRSLIEELEEPLADEGVAGRALIDGILVRRVLGHVTDPRVKALADPGLVVRRITPDVIQKVMTPATSKPKGVETVESDDKQIEPWIVDETEAKNIFDAFRKEVTLVEEDGNALRHRADVREEMLPLIRARRHNRFYALHQLAFDYFRGLAEKDGNDWASAAEAIYHGLWLKVPLGDLNRLWPAERAFDPRIDPDEFPQGGPLNVFVRAKRRQRLTSQEVSVLPRDIALEWLAASSEGLLNEHRVDDSVLRAAAGAEYEALDDQIGVAADVARLLYRAGLWNDASELIKRHLERATPADLVGARARSYDQLDNVRASALQSLVRTWATLAGKTSGPWESFDGLERFAEIIGDPLLRMEVFGHMTIAVTRRRGPNDLVTKLRGVIADAVKRSSANLWPRVLQTVRLAILTLDHDVRDLLAVYIEASERLPRDPESATAVGRLLAKVYGEERPRYVAGLLSGRRQTDEAMEACDEFWRNNKAAFLRLVHEREDLLKPFRTLVAFNHLDWIRPLGNSLSRAFQGEKGEEVRSLLDSGDFLGRIVLGTLEWQQAGVSIVRAAAEQGRLFELAGSLQQWKATLRSDEAVEASRDPDYPQDIFGITEAFLGWHSTIMEMISPPESPTHSSKSSYAG